MLHGVGMMGAWVRLTIYLPVGEKCKWPRDEEEKIVARTTRWSRSMLSRKYRYVTGLRNRAYGWYVVGFLFFGSDLGYLSLDIHE